MTTLNELAKDTLILVCDAGKALLISNSGSPIHPDLKIEKHFEAQEKDVTSPRNERAGRRYDGGGTSGSFRSRSAMETSDQEAEKSKEFSSKIVAQLADFLRDGRFVQLIVVAPPTFLGVLRDKLDDHLRNMILVEIPKNLTDMPVDEIKSTLVDEW